MEKGLDAVFIDVNCLLEVLDSLVVVAHVLVDQPAFYVHGLVFGQLLHDFGELV
jgi:hypothetical protein